MIGSKKWKDKINVKEMRERNGYQTLKRSGRRKEEIQATFDVYLLLHFLIYSSSSSLFPFINVHLVTV